MSMMFGLIPIMWHAVRPSKTVDMVAVVNSFWIPKGYEGLTFFGRVLTPNQEAADRFNTGYSYLKNHEMIHLRQAQSCGDSWIRFYMVYLWYWVKGIWKRRKLRQLTSPVPLPGNIAYLLNPFEIEAYAHMYDLHYLDQWKDGAKGWLEYARMPVEERLGIVIKLFNL